MPRIREISSQVGASGPVGGRQATAQDFGAGIGQGLETFGKGIENAGEGIQRHQDQLEISDANVALAKFQEDETIRLEKAMKEMPVDADPKEFASKFREGYQERLQQLGEKYTSQKAKVFFQEHATSLNSRLFDSARSVQAQLVGQRVKTQFSVGINKAANNAGRNPLTWQSDLKQMTDAIEGYDLGAAEKEALKRQATEQIAEGAFRGILRKDTGIAEEILNSGSMDAYFSQDQKKQLYTEIRVQKSADKADRLAQKQLVEEARKEKEKKAQDDIVKGIYSYDENGNKAQMSVTPRQIVENPDLSPDKKEHLIKLYETKVSEPQKGDQYVFLDTLSKIQSGQITDEEEIEKLVINGKLSYEGENSFMDLRSELQGRRSLEGKLEGQMKDGLLKIAKDYYVKADSFGRDPIGELRYQQFFHWMNKELKIKRKEGKTYSELLDPSSKDWLGRGLKQFQATSEDKLAAMFDKDASIEQARTTERNVGPDGKKESPADYLKRVNQQ